MKKYKNDQCPNCGNDDFMQNENVPFQYRFNEDDKCFEEIEKHYSDIVDDGMKCCDCDAIINEGESNKQGKIVLEELTNETND